MVEQEMLSKQNNVMLSHDLYFKWFEGGLHHQKQQNYKYIFFSIYT